MGQPHLGYGVGLRRPHFDDIFDRKGDIDFLEILVENYMAYGGRPRDVLRRAAAEFPVVLHGVALSIGSVDPLDTDYLDAYARLARETNAHWVSDHLCFSSAFGTEYHDLIPVPFTREALDHLVPRIKAVQAAMPCLFALENPSYYVEYGDNAIGEAEFLTELVERADCGLLLDVNNVWVNAQNHGYDAEAFIDALPLDRVVQIHMAGHYDQGWVIIDTHGDHVRQEVMDLFAYTVARTGPVSTLVEWDNDIPSLDVLVAENARVRAAGEAVHGIVAPEVAA